MLLGYFDEDLAEFFWFFVVDLYIVASVYTLSCSGNPFYWFTNYKYG